MKTRDLFEATETKELITSAIEQAIDKIGLIAVDRNDYDDDYEHELAVQTFRVLHEELWWSQLSGWRWPTRSDLTPLVYKMVRRYVTGLRRQFK